MVNALFTRRMRSTGIVVLLSAMVIPLASAQQWSWPEKLENMQVLPADWTGRRLSPVMRGFTRALGVRCSYCHVGEEGESLATYDFVSDDNPNKDRAREMLRLLGSVNDHLRKIEPSGDQRVNMWCDTCHRGRPKPMTLAEELGAAYRSGGIDSALALYDELRERFYGRGAYDFGEDALNNFGYDVLEQDATLAIQIFTLNTEMFPESSNAFDSLAEAYMTAGDNEAAIRYYTKSLELDPRNDNARARLEDLQE